MGNRIEAAGDYSVAIALNDQTGTVVSQDNTMAIMGGNVGIGTTSPSGKLDVVGTTELNGNVDINSDLDVDGSTLYVNGTTDQVSIGTVSPSAKLDVEVSSGGAASFGSHFNIATGYYAIAMGEAARAYGPHSVAMNYDTNAIGDSSTAMGIFTVATGHASTAMGTWTRASGYVSTAMGELTTASGRTSTAIGREIGAAGAYSVAIALNDQNGAVVSDSNTMAIMGGEVGIGTLSPNSTLQVVGGYLQLPTTTGAPPSGDCNHSSEAGRVIVRTDGPPTLYVCTGTGGWETLA
jgi:hypothetical protein